MAQYKIEDGINPFKKSDSKRRRIIWGGIEINPFLFNQTFQRWIILLILAFVMALIFEYPRFSTVEVGSYVVGDVVQEDIYAPYPIPVLDENKTEDTREKAAEKIAPVFIFDKSVGARIEKNIRTAFETIRNFYQRDWDWTDAEKKRIADLQKEGGNRSAKPIPFIGDEDYSEREAEMRQKFLSMSVESSDKPLDIKDKFWDALKKDRFDKDIENKIIALLMPVLDQGIALNKNEFPKNPDGVINVVEMTAGGPSKEIRARSDSESIQTIKDVQNVIIQERANTQLKTVNFYLRQTIVLIATQMVKPNYIYDAARTDRERQNAKDTVEEASVFIKKGSKIAGKGEIVTDEAYYLLKKIQLEKGGPLPAVSIFGNFLWILALISISYVFASRNIRKFSPAIKDLVQMSILMVFLTIMLKFTLLTSSDVDALYGFKLIYIVPILAGGMMIRLVINSEVALVFSILMSIVSALLTYDPVYGLFVFIGSIVGAEEMGEAKTRSTLVKAGLMTGAANVVMIIGISLTTGQFMEAGNFYNFIFGLSCGIIASFMVLGVTPLMEYFFGYVTDIRLLELANQEHPLLKALIMNAPGTYQHSVTLGILAEEASMAIHVNTLMVKVAALYHDIGKMEKPGYFVENQREGVNPHDTLNPSMSSLVIGSHVKYGIELAKMYRMPQTIIDAIPQHHGTSLMKYFYAKAKEREDPELSPVEEKNFRYPGPRPQTREMAILMLADSVEAAARSLPDPSPTKLRNLVRKIINNIFNDGQLDECDLTLKDLSSIGESFINALSHIYHSRPVYPELPGKKDAGRKKIADQDSVREFRLENDFTGKREDSPPPKKDTVRTKA